MCRHVVPWLSLVLSSLITLSCQAALEAKEEGRYEKEQRENQAKFENYSAAVKDTWSKAGPEFKCVVARIRIEPGCTIQADWLQVAPHLEYRKTSSAYPEPYLVHRSANEFGAIEEVVGHVAVEEIAENERIRRSSVGPLAAEAFKVGPDTPVAIRYWYRKGAVRPGAPFELHECTLLTRNLLPQEASKVRDLIVKSGALEPYNKEFETTEGGYEYYRLGVTVGSITKQINWSGKRAPDSIWPLVNFLESHSKVRTR